MYYKAVIKTNSGIKTDVLNPIEEMVDIQDIAHSLSHQCRFGGHIPIFYSVAQHSVMCASAVSENKLQALLHDASEAYLLDMPKPIKNYLTEYKKIEYNLMKVISNKFGFSYPLSKNVKEADHYVFEYENENLWEMNKVSKMDIWNKKDAEEKFLNMFYNLFYDDKHIPK